MSKFIKPKNGVVYHCIPVEPFGDSILPSTKCGGYLTENERYKLNVPVQEKTPLVFAGTHITKSMAFGLQGKFQEKILNCSIPGSDSELVLACDRKNMLSRQRHISIYEIPRDKFNFIEVDGRERQAISAQAIPFSDTKIAYRANNVKDLMHGGLQILAFDSTFKYLSDSGILDHIDTLNSDDFYKYIGKMVREGKLVWENMEQGVNPCQRLAEIINVAPKKGQRPAFINKEIKR